MRGIGVALLACDRGDVDEPDEKPSAPIGRTIALVLLGLALIAGVVFAIFQRQFVEGVARSGLR